ncbi:hypothetical protein QFZ82_005084 [Streptomyces sp. V4I23]|uniref:hypothetical protein n=1 Tax=Streptomyces sp. V4I23 TaxID=3042282 RepID=UPI00277F49AB|nr:hypothetical protein [Streptomyces sp. V4I23]MDQ1010599.1 hypothetical protein [Streptomyces sp. V4I23]
MRLFNTVSGVRPTRLVTAVVAALAAAAVAAPLSMADPNPATRTTAAGAEAGTPGDLLGTPDNPRVSDGPYAGFQFCGAPQQPVVTSGSATLAATLESVAPPGTVEKPGEAAPGRKVVFEVEEADGKPVLRRQTVSETSQNAALQVAEGRLADGDYRWRVRVQDGDAVSQWTAWCGFTVRTA